MSTLRRPPSRPAITSRPTTYLVARLWIEFTRRVHKIVAPEESEHFGADIGDLLIRTAVYIGTVEDRPMTPANIADYVGIPRATVIRRLRALEAKGIVEKIDGAYCAAPAKSQIVAGYDMSTTAKFLHDAIAEIDE